MPIRVPYAPPEIEKALIFKAFFFISKMNPTKIPQNWELDAITCYKEAINMLSIPLNGSFTHQSGANPHRSGANPHQSGANRG